MKQLSLIILALIWIMAFSSRLFSVVRFESIIHEFDPWFNYRSTIKLVEDGFYEFVDWFDSHSWYPLGRVVGGTVYPGLMFTSGLLHHLLHSLSLPTNIRDICVFIAPIFSGLTSVFVYLFTCELDSPTAGLLAAAFMAIAPGYISRSVAGSYDNEAIAITLLMATFYFHLKAIQGSMKYALFTALSYFYMVSAWGGYIYITNLIPLHYFVLLCMGRYSQSLYTAYSTYYTIGLIASMQIPFVNTATIRSSEHMAPLGVFGLFQLHYLLDRCQFNKRIAITAISLLGLFGLVTLTLSGTIAPWTGRLYSLFDTSYAKLHIPIIASVSEHQPPSWGPYFFDLHWLISLLPTAILFPMTNAHVFVLLFIATSAYSSAIMIRLMLTLTPIVCVTAARTVNKLWTTPKDALLWLPLLCLFVQHATWVTSNAYSSPSVVLKAGPNIIDDFREAYDWLRHNTPESSRIGAWWDYGYQIAGFSNRTVLVDNNTWNNSHIATIGHIMASNERDSYPMLQKLDVDYLLVMYGGLIGYSGDDINKFLWMIRIGEGVFPEIHEPQYFQNGQYRIDNEASKTMKKSLMFKMSYYEHNKVSKTDHVRQSPIQTKDVKLSILDEAYTSNNWLVRIYKVKEREVLGRRWQQAMAFESGKRVK